LSREPSVRLNLSVIRGAVTSVEFVRAMMKDTVGVPGVCDMRSWDKLSWNVSDKDKQ